MIVFDGAAVLLDPIDVTPHTGNFETNPADPPTIWPFLTVTDKLL